MIDDAATSSTGLVRAKRPSAEFAAWCDAEFERRRNADQQFDERRYARARDLVLERLVQLEGGGER